MNEVDVPEVFLDPNLLCEECLHTNCTLVTIKLEKKLCTNCAQRLGVETISISILNNTKTPEQLENYLMQASGYEILSELLDTKLSEYDVALNTMESLYEERCGWIMEYYKENQELIKDFLHEFLRDRDKLLQSLKDQLIDDKIDPYSLEMAAYTNYQNILGASIIASNHDESFAKLVNYVSSTMRFEWRASDIFSPDQHKIQFISTRSNELYFIDVINQTSDKITIKKWTPAKGASWCKINDDTIFFCGGTEKWLLGESLRKNSCLFFLKDIYSDKEHKRENLLVEFFELNGMFNKRASHSALSFENDVYVIGGSSNKSGYKMIEKFNLDTQKWCEVPTTLEVLGSASTCKIDDGILIAGEFVPDIYFFDPKTNEMAAVATLIAGKKILLKSNDAIYCLVDRSLYKSDLRKIDFMLVKDDIYYKGTWWMPSQEICVGTKIFFITEDKGVGELWELDVSTSEYRLVKHDFRIN